VILVGFHGKENNAIGYLPYLELDLGEVMERVRIVFEDDSLIVADKPAGLLTMATEREKEKTLYAFLRAYLNGKRPPEKLFIVHRLDREASGLLVFAKTMAAKEHLQNQFKDHSAGRKYVAVVEGRVKENDFTIRSYLAENAAYRVYSTPDAKAGALAVTHVHTRKRNSKTSVLDVQLETGRKHQIRVHLAEKGHPIVGDRNYGSRSDPLRRLALHGATLAFTHPRTAKRMTFDSPYPGMFNKI
jgi:23S rRNA pseudouridine1911/1915/1917 synthase